MYASPSNPPYLRPQTHPQAFCSQPAIELCPLLQISLRVQRLEKFCKGSASLGMWEKIFFVKILLILLTYLRNTAIYFKLQCFTVCYHESWRITTNRDESRRIATIYVLFESRCRNCDSSRFTKTSRFGGPILHIKCFYAVLSGYAFHLRSAAYWLFI